MLSDLILYDKWLVYDSIPSDERQPRKHDSISYTMSVWYYSAIFVDEDNEEYVEIMINKIKYGVIICLQEEAREDCIRRWNYEEYYVVGEWKNNREKNLTIIKIKTHATI